nr:unnamed protein product [Spirometra erinaceieuropaei]
MVDIGGPQGSVLGPILFLIYVDDAARDLDCEVAMFADDMKIWSVIRGPADEYRLQMNLNRNELAQRLDNLLIAAVAEACDAENTTVENRWSQLRDTLQSTVLAVLGRARRQHQDWFDDNNAVISNLLAEKNRLHKAYVDHPTANNKTTFYRSRRHLQQRLRELQDASTAGKVEEIQGYADRNKWKNFFSAIKAVYGPPTRCGVKVKSRKISKTQPSRIFTSEKETANQRGISLLNIAGNIIAHIVRNSLDNHLEEGLLPESQCGFRRHRGITDMIFAARHLQENCQEMRTHLYFTFVDLTRAFDTLHDGMMARVMDNGAASEAFAVTNGVKQGCVLTPTLFSLMFSAMLMDTYRDEPPGIRIAYRTDGHLLNQRRMHFQSRVSPTTVHQLLFADDCALKTTSEEEM